MNIIKAIKSEKRFKRPTSIGWLYRCNEVFVNKSFGYFKAPSMEDILADDWEIEKEKVAVTKQTLVRFYNMGACDYGGYYVDLSDDPNSLPPDCDLQNELKKLGFKE